jgi:hypothetical protein
MKPGSALAIAVLCLAAPPVSAEENTASPAPEAELPGKLAFDLEGYYRVRGFAYPALFDGQEGWARAMQHRLRLVPVVSAGPAVFKAQVEALDDAVWGDNASIADTSLFAGDPSVTGIDGAEQPSMRLSRAWFEVPVAVGQIRVGRQPSQWGMGLLANGGDGFDDAFGENHYGSTYDRILFATRPIAVVQGILHREDSGIPLIVAVGIDRLVEDPLFQYHGYPCTPDLTEGDEGWDPRCDNDGDGVTDQDHGYSDDSRTAADRRADWWADPEDDVFEMVYVLALKEQALNVRGQGGTLTTGAYVVHRKQAESDSNVLILDYYLNARLAGVIAQFEGLNIRGHTSAITLPGAYNPYGDTDDPLYKDADIWGYMGRLGWENDLLTALLEHGYASGDGNVADADFTGRPLHPDFNVGLLLYEEVLARVTAATWTDSAEGLWSKGGVYNSRYLFPQVTVRPMKNTEVIGGWLVAWPDEPDGSRILYAKGETDNPANVKATAATLGWEADLAVKHRWQEHLLFSLEAGFASVTDRIPVDKAGLDPSGRYFTLQSRVAYEF